MLPKKRRWSARTRKGKRGRPPKPVMIGFVPPVQGFTPMPPTKLPPIILEAAEIEALRLIDLEKCSFIEAGRKMNVSRNTVWRLVENTRRKIIIAILEGRPIVYG